MGDSWFYAEDFVVTIDYYDEDSLLAVLLEEAIVLLLFVSLERFLTGRGFNLFSRSFLMITLLLLILKPLSLLELPAVTDLLIKASYSD